MVRSNPIIERLERENKFLRDQIDRMRQEPEDMPFGACDNSCIVTSTRRGLHTNGGCRCDERKLRMAVQWWKRRAEFLQITIQMMRDGDAVKQRDEMVDMLEERRTTCRHCGLVECAKTCKKP